MDSCNDMIVLAIVIIVIVLLVLYILRSYLAQRLRQELKPAQPASIVVPASIEELRSIVRESPSISIKGAGYSMGGQTSSATSIMIDMSAFNRILPVSENVVRVGAGCRWRNVLEAIGPKYSVAAMQSYSDFSVGGSIGVNAHGQDLDYNPVMTSIEEITVMLPDTHIYKLTPESDLFPYVVGGYGLFGIILEAKLRVVPNEALCKQVDAIALVDYERTIARLLQDEKCVFSSARLDLMNFDRCMVISYFSSKKRNEDHPPEGTAGHGLAMMANYQSLKSLRFGIEYGFEKKTRQITRNTHLSQSVETLNSALYPNENYILQEYFIPIGKNDILRFMYALKNIFTQYDVNCLNITLRYVNPCHSILSYSPQPRIAAVLYIDLNKVSDRATIMEWTQKIIDAALALGGSYYLPYHLFASREQFRKAYPQYQDFINKKREIDPYNKFTSELWRFISK